MISPEINASAKTEWAQNWKVPVVSAVLIMFSYSHYYSLGVFMPHIEQDTGWSRSRISAGMMFVSLSGVLLTPFIGACVDRFGARRIAIPGIILYSAALASTAIVGSSIAHWWAIWTLIGASMLFIAAPVSTAAVVSLFKKSRGLAIAITLCGTGLGAAFTPTISDILQSELGWRGAYVSLAVMGGILCLILISLFFFSASDQQKSRHRQGLHQSRPIDRLSLPGPALRDCLLSTRFLRMLLAALIILIAVAALVVHFVPLLLAIGFPTRTATLIAGIVGISSLGGRVIAGMMLDRFRGTFVGILFFTLPIVPCALMLTEPGIALAIFSAILIGLALGAEFDILAYLTSRYFGLRNYSTLFGAIFGMGMLGTGLGPLLAGVIYDRYENYSILFVALIPIALVAATLIGTLGPYPDLEKSTPQE